MDYTEDDGKMLEDKIFCLVHGTNPQGELIVDQEGHHNEWLSDEELLAKDKVFQSIPDITSLARKSQIGFIEQKYFYNQKDY
jgi:hypothetical protein